MSARHDMARCQAWLVPPLHVHCWTIPPLAVEAALTSRHLSLLTPAIWVQLLGGGDVVVPGGGDVDVVLGEDLLFSPPLTTLRVDFVAQGRRAVEHLLARIAQREPADDDALISQLVVRRSTGPVGQ